MNITKYKRNCPVCGKELFYAFGSGLCKAKKENRKCKSCSLIGNNYMDGIIPWNKGRIGLQVAWNKGKPTTENQKYKLRLATINDLNKKGILLGRDGAKNFNPNACEFINNLNKEKGWNLQHAKNGGEVELYGYFVDGYDKKRNIIFEYDEPSHRGKKNRDFIRQQNLLREIKPTLFLRYDEQNNRLYDAETQSEIPILI